MNGLSTPCPYLSERHLRRNTILTNGPEHLRYLDDMRTLAEIPCVPGHLVLALRKAYEFGHPELIPEIEARLAEAPPKPVDRMIVLIGDCEYPGVIAAALRPYSESEMLEFAKFATNDYGFVPRTLSLPFVEYVATHLPSTGHKHCNYNTISLAWDSLINYPLLERFVLPEQRQAYLDDVGSYCETFNLTALGLPTVIHASRTRFSLEGGAVTAFHVRSYGDVAPKSSHRLGDNISVEITKEVEVCYSLKIKTPLITVKTGASIAIILPGEHYYHLASTDPACLIEYPSIRGTNWRIVMPNSTVTATTQCLQIFDTGLPGEALPLLLRYAAVRRTWYY